MRIRKRRGEYERERKKSLEISALGSKRYRIKALSFNTSSVFTLIILSWRES